MLGGRRKPISGSTPPRVHRLMMTQHLPPPYPVQELSQSGLSGDADYEHTRDGQCQGVIFSAKAGYCPKRPPHTITAFAQRFRTLMAAHSFRKRTARGARLLRNSSLSQRRHPLHGAMNVIARHRHPGLYPPLTDSEFLIGLAHLFASLTLPQLFIARISWMLARMWFVGPVSGALRGCLCSSLSSARKGPPELILVAFLIAYGIAASVTVGRRRWADLTAPASTTDGERVCSASCRPALGLICSFTP